MQRADHDPITLAGFISCYYCKAKSWPTQAEWFGEFILAAYHSVHERDCQARRQFGTVLLNLDGDRGVPKPQRPPRPDTNRCTALTRTGDRCRNGLKDGGLCGVHATRQRQEAS